ncbi:DUF2092 domain-containing protein [Rhizobium indicum]|uniref:DUF2092 domain-containing protein n=1 Tax=Rhizobium indicum TaxID=2583231 RepID=A0ABX6PP49_9HYPH|nr:DUF2092 domain-containing protein [Rhizobium indicum]
MMSTTMRNATRAARNGLLSTALAVFMSSTVAHAGEAEAKSLLKAMSDYLAAQKAISFSYDGDLEIVTKDHQKLLLANSGRIDLGRPDKVRATRKGGFADVEMSFDGKTVTLFGKDANAYTQKELPGSVENLIDALRDKLGRPLPAADLLLPNVYEELMKDVTDVKDLGSGVIGGVECDHLAFRTPEVDWQIWIAQGDQPYPCRYIITSTKVDQGPQYSIRISDWKTGIDVVAADFTFDNKTGAKQVSMESLPDIDDLPAHFAMGEAK